MNKQNDNLYAYLFELPHVGKEEALQRFWTRLVRRGHMPTTLVRHRRQILRILDNAAQHAAEEKRP